MEITLSQRTLHFRKPARTSRGEYSEHDMLIITMRDDNGRIGLGECAPLPDLSCDRNAYNNPAEVAKLIRDALESEDYTDSLRPYPALLFALESAMYDYQQNPILYDTAFARSEVGIPINGLIWMSDYDDMLKQIKQKLLQGFHCIKIKIGAIEWEDEIKLLRLVRSRFSKDKLELRVDANGGLIPIENGEIDIDFALKRLNELAELDIHSIEQPIPQYHWNELAELCQRSLLPIALDEELIGVNNKAEKELLLDTIKPQYIVVKPTLHGGISGSLEWINEANKRGISSWLTSALESNIGLRNVALLAGRVYGNNITFPQGLGTGLLYTDNIEMDVEIRGNKLWREEVEPVHFFVNK